MNDNPKVLAITGKLGAGTPSGSELIDAQESAEKRSSLAHQNAIDVMNRSDVTGSTATIGASAYAEIETDFRDHHHTNATQPPGPYEHYRLVYRYGYDLGADPRYRDASWSTVEQAARPRWEERNPGTWEQFKEMIRYAWDTARGRRGDDS